MRSRVVANHGELNNRERNKEHEVLQWWISGGNPFLKKICKKEKKHMRTSCASTCAATIHDCNKMINSQKVTVR